MRCSSLENCFGFSVESHRPSPAVDREVPLHFRSAKRWAGNPCGEIRVQCFLSVASARIDLGIGTENLQNYEPRWLQEELIPSGTQQSGAENGGLCTEQGRQRMKDGEPYVEETLSEIAEPCMSLGTARSSYEKTHVEDFVNGDRQSGQVMMIELAQEDGMRLKDSAKKTHIDSQNEVVHYVNLLKSCAEQHDLQTGSRIHADLVRNGLLDSNIIIGNSLINMYAKCGDLQMAQMVFDGLPARSIASWNVLIARYVQNGHDEKALYYFERMQSEGFCPNAVTFTCILKACGSLCDLDRGQGLHIRIMQEGLIDTNIHVGTALVDMYAKCGLLSKAQEVFDELPDRNLVTWTALIMGYVQYDHGEEALRCFERMQLEGFTPDEFTFTCILKACCSTGNVDKGKEIHAWVARECLLEKNTVIASALIDMYAKCGELQRAQGVFDLLPVRDKIVWTALITGYTLHGYAEEALICYEQLLHDGFSPNEMTFVGVLKACSSLGALEKGQEVHARIIREGLLDNDAHISTAVIDMYGKCGLNAMAEEVFENLRARDVAIWTALITTFVQHEQVDEAFDYFKRMRVEGISPDAITISCLLTACGSVAAADIGQRLHVDVVKLGLVEEDMVVGTALVDMYANCGMLLEAQDVFNKLEVQDAVTWTALMGGYAQLGKVETVFKLLDEMALEGKVAIAATFVIVLNTCSHGGLMDEGKRYFEILSRNYGIIPNAEQHTCMIDLFGRAGQVEKAVAFICEMPLCATPTMWITFLTACRRWGNMKLGRWAFNRAIQEDEKDGSAYISMSNIYAAAGRHGDADKIEAMRVAKQAWSLNQEISAFLLE